MNKAVLLIAHGAEESRNKDVISKHKNTVSDKTNMKVYSAYLRMEPSIKNVMCQIAKDNIDELIIVPLFFAPGFLPNKLVPREIGIPENSDKGTVEIDGKKIQIKYTGTFGDHELMKPVMEDMCIAYKVNPNKWDIVLVLHGSTGMNGNPYAEKDADYLRALGYKVCVIFNEFQEPSVEQFIEKKNFEKNILMIPMFVSPGNHSSVEIPEKIGMKPGEKEIVVNNKKIVYTHEIGMHPYVANIIVERIKENQ